MSRKNKISVPRYRFTKEETVQYRPLALIEAALKAWPMAYAPYSHFRVGVSAYTTDGSVYTGCNWETANYDGTHGEESAISSMVMDGRRDPEVIAIVGALDSDDPKFEFTAPCGKCRQALLEFAQFSGNETKIIVPIASHGKLGEELGYVRLDDLLPMSFGPQDIGIDTRPWRKPSSIPLGESVNIAGISL